MRAKIKVISSSLIFKIISTLIAIVSISAIFVCNFSKNRTEISADSGTYVGTFNGVAHYSSEFDADHTVNYLGMVCYIGEGDRPYDEVVYLTGIQTDSVDADTNPNDTAPYANCNTINKFDSYSVRKHVVINAKIKYGNGLFANCGNLESIDIQSNADFSELEGAYKMFINCNNESLTSFDFSNADLSALKSANRMFEGCSHVTKFTFDDNRLPVNLTDAYHMFKGTGLTKLDLSKWKINGSTDAMFEGCSALSTLTFSSTASTYNSTNGYHLFAGCSSLTSLDLSGWTINNCTTDSMFDGCGALSTLKFSSTANTYNSINAWHMFKGTGLTTLDLSGWAITGNTDSMFEYSTNLSTLTFSSVPNTYNSTNAYHLLKGTSITSLDLSGWTINGSTNGMFEACSALITLTFSSAENAYKSNDAYYMFNGCTNLTSLDLSNFDFTTPTSCLGMFSGCEAIKTITFGPKCTFEACTDFSWMFNNCKQLRYSTFTSDSVNTLFSVSMFNTSKATTMERMFCYCTSISELNLGSFNTKLVTKANEMFKNTNISTFTFGTDCTFDACENMSGMFGDNQCLSQLDISNFNTAACKDISSFVGYDRNLTKITFPANAFSNCTNFNSAFYELETAKNIDFSKLNTQNADDMSYMFAHSTLQMCTRNDLATLDLSNFDTSNVTKAEGMFSYNTKPLEIIFGDNCTFANCTNFKDMFKNSSGIKKIDLSTFSIKTGANVTDMLSNTNGLHELIIKDTTTNVTINLNGTYHLAETKVNELDKTVVKKVTNNTYTQIPPSTSPSTPTTLYLIKEYDTETHEIKHEFTEDGVCSVCGFENYYLGTYNGITYHSSDITDSYKENGVDVEYFNWHGMKVYVIEIGDKQVGFMIGDQTSAVPNNESLEGNAYYAPYAIYNETKNNRTVNGKNINIDAIVVNAKIISLDSLFRYSIPTEIIFGEKSVLEGVSNPYQDEVELGYEKAADFLYTFNGCNAQIINMKEFKTADVPIHDFAFMCYYADKLKTLIWPDDMIGKYVTGMSYAFNATSSLETMDMKVFKNTSKLRDMPFAFQWCGLKSLVFAEEFDTRNVTGADYCFADSSMESITFGQYCTFENVSCFSSVFKDNHSIESLDLTYFNTKNATNAQWMFSGCNNLESITFGTNCTFENCTNFGCPDSSNRGMFSGCESLTSLDLSMFDTKSAENMSNMFKGCTNLKAIKFGTKFTCGNCTDFHSMFENCNNLKYSTYTSDSNNTPFSVLMFNTSKATNMNSMFKHTSFTSLNLSSWNTASVTDASGMFNENRSIQSIAFGENCTFAACTNMNDMFRNATGLLGLDLTYFNTKKVLTASYFVANAPVYNNLILGDNCTFEKCNDFSHAFEGMFGATNKFDLSKLNTSSATNMSGMFYQFGSTTDSLSMLDLSNFDTSNVTDASNMFHHFKTYGKPTEIIFGTNCTFAKCTNFTDMFSNLDNIKKLDLSTFSIKDNANVTNMFLNTNGLHELIIKNATSNVTINLNGTYHLAVTEVNEQGKTVVKKVTDTTYTQIAPGTLTDVSYLIKEYDTDTHEIKHEFTNGVCSICGYEDLYLGTYNSKTYHLSDITDSFKENDANVEYFNWLGMKVYVKVIDGKQVGFMIGDQTDAVNYYDSEERNASYAPYAIYNETVNNRKVNEENINIGAIVVNAKITNLSSLFRYSIPTEIIFGENSVLEGYSNYSPTEDDGLSKAADFYWTFNNCKAQKIDMKKFKTTGVAIHDFNSMCNGASDLKTLIWPDDMSGKYVTGMSYAFCETRSLETMDMTVFKETSRLGDMNCAFSNCGLTSLTFDPTFDTSKVTNVSYCFQCNSMESITFGPKCTFESVEDFSKMFYSNGSIKSLNLSMFDTQNAKWTDWMFANCYNLQSITFGENCTFEQCTSFGGDSYDFGMFSGCSSLTSLDLSMFDTSSAVYMQNMFRGCTNLKAIEFGTKFTCGNCTDFHNMFKDCNNLQYSTYTSESNNTPFSVLMFDTKSATNMGYMFQQCRAIGALDLTSFDTKSVLDATNMFRWTNISTFTFGEKCTFDKCENMSGMFSENQSLRELDISGFKTAACTNISQFVEFDRYLTKITFPENAFLNCTNFSKAFYGLETAKNIDFSKLNTQSAVDMSFMFKSNAYQFSELTTLDLSNFDTRNVTNAEGMFGNCIKPIEITFGPNCTFEKCTNFKEMFRDSSGLKKIDLSTFSIIDGVDVTDMFLNTNGVHELIIKNATSDVTIDLNGTYHLAETKVNELGKTVVKKVTDATYTEIAPNTLTDVSYLIKEDNETHEIKHEFTDGVCSICGYEDYYLGTYNGISYHVSDITDSYKENDSDVDYFNWLGMKVYVKVLDDGKQVGFMIGKQTASAVKYYSGTLPNSNCAIRAPYASYNNEAGEQYNNRTVNGNPINITALVNNAEMNDLKYLFFKANKNMEEIIFDSNSKLVDEVDDSVDMIQTFYRKDIDTEGNLKTIDMSMLDTSAVSIKDMSGAFEECSSVTSIKLPSDFNGSSVTSLSRTFFNTASLTTIDLSSFVNTSNLSNMSNTFASSGIKNVEFEDDFDTSKVTNASSCFENSKVEIVKFGTKATFETCTDFSKMFKGVKALKSVDLSYLDSTKLDSLDNDDNVNASSMFEIDSVNCTTFTTLTLGTNATFKTCTDFSNMFNGCKNLTINVSNFDTSKATNMSGMFRYCSSLEGLNVSNFVTTNVTNMSYMFGGCSSLKTLNVTNFVTTNVTNMSHMFNDCSSLGNLVVSNLDTTNVTNMSYMFGGCSSLETLNVSNFVTTNVTNMSGMFSGCSSLGNLVVSNLDTTNVTNMSYMFNGCSSLETLDVSNKFKTTNVTTMTYMFNNCSSLKALDVSNFDTTKVADMSLMFRCCSSLKALDVSNFDTTNVTKMNSMFYNCSSLETLDVSNKFKTTNVTDMSYMFKDCSGLETLNLSNFVTTNVTNMSNLFAGCSSLKALDLSTFSIKDGANVSYMFLTTNGMHELIIKNEATNVTIDLYGTYHLAETKVIGSGATAKTVVKKVTDTTYTKIEPGTLTDVSYLIKEYSSVTHEIKHEFTNGVCSICGYEDIYLGTYNGTSYHVSDIEETYTYNGSTVDYFEWHGMKVYVKVINGKQVGFMIGDQTSAVASDDNTVGNAKYAPYAIYDETKNNRTVDGVNINIDAIVVNAKIVYLDSLFRHSIPTEIIFGENSVLEGVSNPYSDEVELGYEKAADFMYTFNGCNAQIINMKDFKTAGVAIHDLNSTCAGASKLKSLIWPEDMIVKYVRSMTSAFNGTAKLETMDMTVFKNTSQLRDMNFAFQGCGLKSLVFDDDFDTSNVRGADYCFSGTSMESITFGSKCTFENVNNFYAMFYSNGSLKSLDLKYFNTKNAINAQWTFANNDKLESITFGTNCTFENCTHFGCNEWNHIGMFSGCSSLTSLDLSMFNTKSAKDMSHMFKGCTNLKAIEFGENFKCGNCTDFHSMFEGCNNLKYSTYTSENNNIPFDISMFDTSSATNMNSMFSGMTNLTELDISSFDMSSATTTNIFDGDEDLELIKIPAKVNNSAKPLLPTKKYGWRLLDSAKENTSDEGGLTVLESLENKSSTSAVYEKADVPNLELATVEGTLTKPYIGKQITIDDLVVKFNGQTLVNGTDYSFALDTDFNAKTHNLTITGLGDFVGQTKEVSYEITKAIVNIDLSSSDYSSTLHQEKTYDGTDNGRDDISITTNGVEDEKLVTTFTSTYSSKDQGTRNIIYVPTLASVSGGQGKTSNYDVNYTNKTLTNYGKINKKEITYTLGTLDKTYDGTKTQSVSVTVTDGAVTGDESKLQVSTSITETFESSNIGTYYSLDHASYVSGKKVTLSAISLSGDESDNYFVLQPTSYSGTIGAIGLSDEMFNSITDTYEYTGKEIKPEVTIKDSYDDQIVPSRDLIITYSNNINVTNEAVITITANPDGNFSTSTVTLNFTITEKVITIDLSSSDYSTALHQEKDYDGTVDGRDDITIETAGVEGETLVTTFTSTYSSKDQGTRNIIYVPTLSSVIGGQRLTSNYNVSYDNTTLTDYGKINRKEITYTLGTLDKTYDGTNTQSVSVTINSGVVSGEEGLVSINPSTITETFDKSDVGTYTSNGESGNKVTLSEITLDGTGKDNYFVKQPSSFTGKINPMGLTSEMFKSIPAKEYTGVQITPSIEIADSYLSQINITRDLDIEYGTNIDAGTNSGVITVKAKSTGNFAGSGDVTLHFDITRKEITIDLSAEAYKETLTYQRIYDSTTNVDVTGKTLTTPGVEGETLVTTFTSAVFDDKNVGENKTITYTPEFTNVSGGRGKTNNYTVTYEHKALAYGSITPKQITYTTSTTKEFDDNDVSSTDITLNTSDICDDDKTKVGVTSPVAGTYDNKNVGTNKDVTPSSVSVVLTGDEKDNYYCVDLSGLKGSITLPSGRIHVSEITDEIIYDGTAHEPALTIMYDSNNDEIGDVSLIEGTDYRVSYTSNINAGTANAEITYINNYAETPTGNVSFTITAKDVSIDLNEYIEDLKQSKTYDSTVDADDKDITKVVTDVTPNETLHFELTAKYSNKNYGTRDLIYTPTFTEVTGGQELKANYNITYAGGIVSDSVTKVTLSNAGTIDRKEIAYTLGSLDKSYDGTDTNTNVTVTINNDEVFASDIDKVTISSPITATFESSNVGTYYSENHASYVSGKKVTLSTISLSGDESNNYCVNPPTSYTGEIKLLEIENGANITVSGIEEAGYEFTGTNITFDSEITVTWGAVELRKGTDYSLSYTDNINVNSNETDILSNPQLNIHLMGNFMGDFSEPFKINKKVLTISNITLSNSTPILKERDGDSKLDDEDKLVMTYTNSVNGDIVSFTYTDADYEKNGTAFSEEGKDLDIKAEGICINTDTSINSKQILNNYEFVTTDYTFSGIGEIDDSIGPKITSIVSVEPKTYGLGQVIRFKITSDEPMTAPSGSTFTIKFTEDLGVVKTATYTGTGNGAYSTEYVLTYTVGEGESASDGLTLSEIEVSSLGFTDKYGNGVTFSDMASIIASSETSFSNTFINTAGVLLEITADCADTTANEEITYTFKFTTEASGIDETTFTLDDIYVIHDDTNTKDYDYLNTYKVGEITKVDDKTFTLKVSNRDFIGEDDTNGKNFILGIEAGKISDTLGNKSSAASKIIKVDRTLSPVTSDVTSGSIVKGSKLITLTPRANSFIAYKLNETSGTLITRPDKGAYSFKLSDSDIAEKLINGTITFYDTISSGVEKFANSVANVFTFTLRNKEHVYHDVMTEANDDDKEGIKPFIKDSEDMTTLGVKTENVSKLSNISNTSLHDYVAENIILEKENITDSDTLRRYIDDFVEIKTKFDDDDEFGKINKDYDDTYDYEKLMIMYEELNPHQKAIIKATIVPITMGTENEKSYYELLREYYLKYIMGHKVRKDMETNEEANDETVADTIIEVFGVINNTIKEPTDKIKVVVEKITDQSDIDVIETKLETTEDYKKDNSNEKILAPYDIYLAKVSDGSRVEVAPDTTILVKLELPPQFANEIIHIFHIHDGESSEVIDNVAYDKYALDNKCIVYFKADMFSDFVLTSATKSLVVSKDTTEAEGEVSPRGVLALSDEETEKSININVPSETKAEVYINGELKDTITKVGATEYIVKDINEITYVVVKFKVNKTEKPQDDNPTTLTIIRGITVEYISDKHEEVISGYQDKTFRPNENITREEVAAMIARQDKGYSENINYREYLNGIKDVKKTSWSANYLGYCVMKGIIVPNANCIRPNSKATRAEVAKMIVTIKGYNTNGLTSSFSDSNGHWYDGYVAALEDRTIISGYKDHTFKGTDKMTRAEFTKVMNLASNRFPNINKVSRETIKETLKKFKDVKETSWYFKYLVEMSNEHAVKDMH